MVFQYKRRSELFWYCGTIAIAKKGGFSGWWRGFGCVCTHRGFPGAAGGGVPGGAGLVCAPGVLPGGGGLSAHRVFPVFRAGVPRCVFCPAGFPGAAGVWWVCAPGGCVRPVGVCARWGCSPAVCVVGVAVGLWYIYI